MTAHPPAFDFPPYRLTGVVYGTLLNARAALAELGNRVDGPPYQMPPRAPILYLKPRNTQVSSGASIVVPRGTPALRLGAALGIVIGRTSCRLSCETALDHVAGYMVVGDIGVPHASFYRPAIRFIARDGFCPLGAEVVPRHRVADPDDLAIEVAVDGAVVQTTSTSGMVRSVARLLADVTEFMTLGAGDVLMLGVGAGAPLVRAGQQASLSIEGVGRLQASFVEEAA